MARSLGSRKELCGKLCGRAPLPVVLTSRYGSRIYETAATLQSAKRRHDATHQDRLCCAMRIENLRGVTLSIRIVQG